ncbi:hypothetical protein Tco_1093738 [Tanacetum coccineum]|uniref:Uncharacterized protein n=1 Tax=Tanacetum coccineum TaxID=301880 RepID=A0ABQ5IEU4_9ASTR
MYGDEVWRVEAWREMSLAEKLWKQYRKRGGWATILLYLRIRDEEDLLDDDSLRGLRFFALKVNPTSDYDMLEMWNSQDEDIDLCGFLAFTRTFKALFPDNNGQTLEALNQRVIEQSSRSLNIHGVYAIRTELQKNLGCLLRIEQLLVNLAGILLKKLLNLEWMISKTVPNRSKLESSPRKSKLWKWKQNAGSLSGKSADKLSSMIWAEKHEHDGPRQNLNADNAYHIGAFLDVPIGQELNSTEVMSVTRGGWRFRLGVGFDVEDNDCGGCR